MKHPEFPAGGREAAGFSRPRRRCLAAVLAAGAACLGRGARAHGFRAGDLTIEHPHAPPTPPDARTAAVYLRALVNHGDRADRLIGASTALAESVELQRRIPEGDVPRLQAVPAIDLPAGAQVDLTEGGGAQLRLLGLKAPLHEGQRFALRLRFERAGEHEVVVWVHAIGGAATHAH